MASARVATATLKAASAGALVSLSTRFWSRPESGHEQIPDILVTTKSCLCQFARQRFLRTQGIKRGRTWRAKASLASARVATATHASRHTGSGACRIKRFASCNVVFMLYGAVLTLHNVSHHKTLCHHLAHFGCDSGAFLRFEDVLRSNNVKPLLGAARVATATHASRHTSSGACLFATFNTHP